MRWKVEKKQIDFGGPAAMDRPSIGRASIIRTMSDQSISPLMFHGGGPFSIRSSPLCGDREIVWRFVKISCPVLNRLAPSIVAGRSSESNPDVCPSSPAIGEL